MLHKFLVSLSLLAFILAEVSCASEIITTDCAKIPKPIAPDACCHFPVLFKKNVLDICNSSDEMHKKHQCFFDCVFTKTEICRKGTCDYRKAEDYVDWVMKPEEPFSNIYKLAYAKCIKKANDMRSNMIEHLRVKRHGCDPQPEIINLCVQNEMFTSCPAENWNDENADCVNKRNFITNCVRDE